MDALLLLLPLIFEDMSENAMVYLLPYNQVKPTCFVANYCSGNFPNAKECCNCTLKCIPEVAQGEIEKRRF
jgi:hypothetical protein